LEAFVNESWKPAVHAMAAEAASFTRQARILGA
jgi:hypothetical protein